MNTLSHRAAEFLKQYAPFNNLSLEELISVASDISVIILEKNKTLFQINDTLHSSFYMVASGVINLSVISDSEETLLNKCVAGDVFGLRPFFAKNNYMMTAKAREECVVYAIPITTFRPFVAQNQDVLNFLLESFAYNTSNPDDKQNKGKLLSDNVTYTSKPTEIQYFQTLSYNKTPLIVTINQTIREIAMMMTDNLVDNALITENGYPIGIVTDTDMRTKIATGRYEIISTINKIMSSPVITVNENVSLAEAQLLLLKNNVSHLCVTVDGTDKSDIKGIITEHDLIVSQASNPGVFIKEIKRSQNASDLTNVRLKLSELVQTSLTKNIPLLHISNIASEINIAIIKRSVELAILELGSPPASFAWFCIGSLGRKEQLLLTDQDSILIFEDVATEKYRDVKNYFLKLAKKTINTLEIIGYKQCENGHIASNMSWCKSISEWTRQYSSWMNLPGEKNNEISSIFFEYEVAFGEKSIGDVITDLIFENSKKTKIFFDFMGNDALRKPTALSFFKNFNVEETGINKGKFDIKNRAILQLVDCARLLTMSQNIKGINNTYLRFKQLAMIDPKHSEIYLNCADSFQTLSKLKTSEGLKYDNSGQFINIEDLSKINKESLKNAITPLKDLEELIKDSFQLTQFS